MSSSDRRAALNELLRRLVSQKKLQHAVFAVENADRSFRWVGAAGIANAAGEPMREETPFHIASIDKLMTASAVLKLHERGAIALDEPIPSYLPQQLVGGLHRLDGVDYSGAVTIRHLLGHTSGLADCFEDRPKGGLSMMERLFSEGDLEWTIDELAEIVRKDLTPHFPPQPADSSRQKVRYSDTNYQLLIAIIEAVSGQALHRYFEEQLFRPIDLRHTYVLDRSQPLDPTPDPAAIYFAGKPLDLPRALRSFPSVYSTAADLLAFLRALLAAELFDRPETLALMSQRWNRFGFALDPAALRSPGWPIEYGLGMMRFRLPRLFSPVRAMPAVIGHTGSSGSWLFHCPELDLFLCGTVDEATSGAVPYRFVPRLLRAMQA